MELFPLNLRSFKLEAKAISLRSLTEGGGEASTKFFTGKENGIEVTNHTPWKRRRRAINKVFPTISPLPIIRRTIDTSYNTGGGVGSEMEMEMC